MSNQYDIIIVTHLPSSYKVNLYNEIAKNKNVYVVFIASNSIVRTKDFLNLDCNFNYSIINNSIIEKRNIYKSTYNLFKILYNIRSKYIILNGWDLFEFWFCVFLPFYKKGIAIESTIYETKLTFAHILIKRIFLFFTHFALPSGEPHLKILKKLKYKKDYQIVSGVGIPNIYYQVKNTSLRKNDISNSFLFIGRLVKEKNIFLLLKAFSKLPHLNLTIVGSGPLELKLKKYATKNVTFIGHVDNSKLNKILSNHNSLILPSLSEPWGLVIEEAIINNLPVIVSSYVGCNIDLVQKYNFGIVFNNNNIESLIDKIQCMLDYEIYNSFRDNNKSIYLNEMYARQIYAYSLNWLN